MSAIVKSPTNLLAAVQNVLSLDEMLNPMSWLSTPPTNAYKLEDGSNAWMYQWYVKGNCIWLHEYSYSGLCEINGVTPFYE